MCMTYSFDGFDLLAHALVFVQTKAVLLSEATRDIFTSINNKSQEKYDA